MIQGFYSTRFPNRRGYSLIEVMIASIILVIGIVALVPALNVGIKNNKKAQRFTEAALLAKDIFEQLEHGAKIEEKGFSGQFSWTIEKADSGFGREGLGLGKYILTISWYDGDRLRSERFVYVLKEVS